MTAKKKAAYTEYRAANDKMREVLTVKANINALLGEAWQEKNKEKEQSKVTAYKGLGPQLNCLPFSGTPKVGYFE